jgi:hypothetical protein
LIFVSILFNYYKLISTDATGPCPPQCINPTTLPFTILILSKHLNPDSGSLSDSFPELYGLKRKRKD